MPISSDDARALVRRYHYSGKVVQNSQLHLGVFLDGRCGGAMQFGPSLDKRKTGASRPRRIAVAPRYGAKIGGEASLKPFIDVGAKYVPGYQLRYVYFLDPAYRAKLSVPEVAFSEIQKRGAGMYRGQSRAGSDPVDTPGVQPGEGGSTPTPALSLCEGVALA